MKKKKNNLSIITHEKICRCRVTAHANNITCHIDL